MSKFVATAALRPRDTFLSETAACMPSTKTVGWDVNIPRIVACSLARSLPVIESKCVCCPILFTSWIMQTSMRDPWSLKNDLNSLYRLSSFLVRRWRRLDQELCHDWAIPMEQPANWSHRRDTQNFNLQNQTQNSFIQTVFPGRIET